MNVPAYRQQLSFLALAVSTRYYHDHHAHAGRGERANGVRHMNPDVQTNWWGGDGVAVGQRGRGSQESLLTTYQPPFGRAQPGPPMTIKEAYASIGSEDPRPLDDGSSSALHACLMPASYRPVRGARRRPASVRMTCGEQTRPTAGTMPLPACKSLRSCEGENACEKGIFFFRLRDKRRWLSEGAFTGVVTGTMHK